MSITEIQFTEPRRNHFGSLKDKNILSVGNQTVYAVNKDGNRFDIIYKDRVLTPAGYRLAAAIIGAIIGLAIYF